MCLYTKQKEPLIAKKPIKAFKVLIRNFKGGFFSPFQDYDYTEYVNDHCIVEDIIPKVEPPHYNINITILSAAIRVVHRGLHLFINKDKAIETASQYGAAGVIFECEIPVGSYYFLSEGETEICTNQFRFIKECK